jgi:hypothetical protein
MAIIKSGATADELTIDVTSKAARSTLYRPSGELIYPTLLGRYVTPIKVRQTTAAAADTVPWALWNQNGTRTIRVLAIKWRQFFDGTAAATLMRYEFTKVTGVTAFSGGSTVTAVILRTTEGAPVSGVARLLDTGLTLTGGSHVELTAANPHGRVTQTTTVFNASEYEVNFLSGYGGSLLELNNQEALALRLDVVAVIGDNVAGAVFWEEV